MSNSIKNRSKLLYLQARNEFEKAKKKFEDGSIKSERHLIQAVFTSFETFFVNMGKPNLIPRYAVDGGPPWSEDYNDMMDEIFRDLETLYQEVDILGRALYLDFNHSMMQYESLKHEFNQVQDKLKDLELLTQPSAEGKLIFHRNEFANTDAFDFDKVTGAAGNIENGLMTLKQKNRTNESLNASISIIVGNRKEKDYIIGSESNGFPGNSHEISVAPSDNLTNSEHLYRFLGEKNHHADWGVAIDGNPNSWFEYEVCNIREHDRKNVAKNLGFDLLVHENQSITWAREPENGILKLHMQMVLQEVKMINHINVNMYTPPNYGAKTAIVKDILISDGTSPMVSILSSSKKPEDYSFYFTPRKAKIISILFEQSEKYYTDIGHVYYESKLAIQDQAEYAFNSLKKKESNYALRVDGPKMTLQDLGVEIKADDRVIEASYPLRSSAAEVVGVDDIIRQQTLHIEDENMEQGIERFAGWRYCIGIRDIEVYSFEYEEESEMITEPYYFDRPLDRISISAEEDIPFEIELSETEKYKWIKYYVSIDDGATWYPITPVENHEYSENREEEPPKIYIIQQIGSSKLEVTGKRGYIESEYPVYSIRLRMVLKRPAEEE